MVGVSDVIARLKAFGCNVKDGDNDTIECCIDSVEEYILNFCNLKSVPVELYNTAVDMCCGRYIKNKSVTGDLDIGDIDFSSEGIKSITEGDVSITYGGSSDGSSAAVNRLNKLIDGLCNRDRELAAFRKLRW